MDQRKLFVLMLGTFWIGFVGYRLVWLLACDYIEYKLGRTLANIIRMRPSWISWVKHMQIIHIKARGHTHKEDFRNFMLGCYMAEVAKYAIARGEDPQAAIYEELKRINSIRP
jgi:hypothetical protein